MVCGLAAVLGLLLGGGEAVRWPVNEPDQIAHLNVRRRERLGGILNEYEHAA